MNWLLYCSLWDFVCTKNDFCTNWQSSLSIPCSPPPHFPFSSDLCVLSEWEVTHGVALSVSDHHHLHHMLSNTNIELHSNTMSYISKNWITVHRTGTGAISISPPAPPSPSYALQYGELHLKTLSYISIHRATSQCIELHFNTMSYISKNRITVHRTGAGHH